MLFSPSHFSLFLELPTPGEIDTAQQTQQNPGNHNIKMTAWPHGTYRHAISAAGIKTAINKRHDSKPPNLIFDSIIPLTFR